MLFKISQNNPYYRKAILQEASKWGRVDYEPDVRQSFDYQPQLRDYFNEVFTGKPTKDWIEYILEKFGPFKKGCSFGCGIGKIEERFIKLYNFDSFDFYDLSSEALKKLQERLSKNPSTHYSFIVADLNFIELRENLYDFIFCNNILHHLLNLEHFLFQTRKALTSTGVLVVRDYIGENRF